MLLQNRTQSVPWTRRNAPCRMDISSMLHPLVTQRAMGFGPGSVESKEKFSIAPRVEDVRGLRSSTGGCFTSIPLQLSVVSEQGRSPVATGSPSDGEPISRAR